MFSKELTELLIQVVQSWQVIAVTIALVLFLYLVSYVARSYRRPRSLRVQIQTEKSKTSAPAQRRKKRRQRPGITPVLIKGMGIVVRKLCLIVSCNRSDFLAGL